VDDQAQHREALDREAPHSETVDGETPHHAPQVARFDRTSRGISPRGHKPRGEIHMPQEAWSNKRERQYEHIKDSAKKRGTSTKRAKQIAAATVNKERARSGEAKTASRSSTRDISSGRRGGLRSGTNRPKGRTKEQLYNEAKRRGIKGRSSMNKQQLQRALAGKS
jgi:hypothetical protein